MKIKKLFAAIGILCVILYFFGSSPIKEFWTTGGNVGKFAFGITILALTVGTCFLLKKYTNFFEILEKYLMQDRFREILKKFHVEPRDVLILLMILLIGGGLRFGGINWGITSIFQPDENNLLNDTIEMAVNKCPYQKVFKYPNQCVSKLAAFVMIAYSVIRNVALDTNTIECYFIYRYIVAIFSTLTIITGFLIGNYLEKKLGLFVAALIAFFPEYVNLSKQVTGDSTSFFFLTLLLLGSLLYMERRKRFWIAFMTFFTACATMEKWHAAVGCFYIAFIIICTERNTKGIIREGSFAFLSYIIGMFLIAPNMFWKMKEAISGVLYMYQYDADGVTPYKLLIIRYIDNLHCYMGGIAVVIFVLGCITIIKNYSSKYFVLLLGVIKLGALGFLNRGFPRWGLEFYFTIIMVISIGLLALIKNKNKVLTWMGWTATGIIGGCFLIGSILVYSVAIRSNQDTRLQQEKFCAENEILREESIFDFYTGFDPGGIRAGREYGGRNLLFYELGEMNGELCLYMEDIKYAVDNIGYKDSLQTQKMHELCPLVAKFEGRIGDTFTNPAYNVTMSWTEVGVIKQYIGMLKYVWHGGATGPKIEIYDVSALPVYSKK